MDKDIRYVFNMKEIQWIVYQYLFKQGEKIYKRTMAKMMNLNFLKNLIIVNI